MLILLYLKCWPKNLLIMTMLSLRNKNKTNYQEGHGTPLLLGVELRVLRLRRLDPANAPMLPTPLASGHLWPSARPPWTYTGCPGPGYPSLRPAGTGKVRRPFPCRVSACPPRHHSLSSGPCGIGQKPRCEAETPGTWLLSSCPLPGQHARL